MGSNPTLSSMVKKNEPPFVNHKRENRYGFDDVEGSLDSIIQRLQELAKNKINPRISIERDYDSVDVFLEWDEPMTEEQIVKEKARRLKVANEFKARKERQKLVNEIKKTETVDAALDILKKDPELAAEFLKKFN